MMSIEQECITEYNEEPVDVPLTNFIIQNIGSYNQLNPEDKSKISEAFEEALSQAISEAQSSLLTYDNVSSGGIYGEVHKDLTYNDQRIEFVVKVLRPCHADRIDRLKDEYEILRKHLARILLPVTFITAKVYGEFQNIALQREVKDAMSLAKYFKHCHQAGQSVPSSIKQTVDIFIQGLLEMYRTDGRKCDIGWLTLYSKNLVVDPKTDKLWLIDSNILGFRSENADDDNGYFTEIREYRSAVELEM